MVFQYSALFDSLNVFENISFALRERKELRKLYNEEQLHEIVAQKLELVGLQGIENKFPSELSGGMQKRVSFARAIVTQPNTILYDEPTAGLDPMSSTLIEDYIVRLKHEINAASIVVTHQMSTITRTADRVIMLYDGKIVFEGTPDELLKQDTPYTKQFVTASLEGPMQMKA
jgi:phospholipid/cholesterol/gamma-HCH transport system ATP-binding protein